MAFTDTEIAEVHEAVRRQGDSDNLYKLGLIYSTGQDVDLVQAHMWFNLAASRGSEAAKDCRRDISDLMTRDLIAEAQRRAREWLSVKHHSPTPPAKSVSSSRAARADRDRPCATPPTSSRE
jgi:uncharacterized protein